MSIIIDPEFQSLIPPLGAEELQQLKLNIIRDGCRDPLVVWNGILIDGHNRYEICTTLGIGFDTTEIDLESRVHARIWIRDNQMGRRNLTTAWGIELQLGNKEDLKKIGLTNKSAGGKNHKGNQYSGMEVLSENDKTPIQPVNTRKEIAKAANTSTGMVGMAEQIKKKDEKLWEKAKSGEVSISTAYGEIRKDEKKQQKEKEKTERIAAAAKIESAVPSAKRRPIQSGEWWQLGDHLLFCGDTSSDAFRKELIDSQLAFADPPYGAGKDGYDDSKFYWEHDYLNDVAEIIVVTPGIVSIFEFAAITGMPYKWSISCWINNGMTRGAIGFGNWIYGAVFSRGSIFRQKQDFCQVAISNSETDDTSHTTRKPAGFMAYVIETFTNKGETVIDPFLGSGQTLLSCEAMGRKCTGGEIDPNFCQAIIARWEAMTGQEAYKR